MQTTKQQAIAALPSEWQQFAYHLDNEELTACLANSLDVAVCDSNRLDLVPARDAIAAYAFGSNAERELGKLRAARDELVRSVT